MDRRDPDPAADERTTLTQFLDHHRATLLRKAAGLGPAELNRRLPPSSLTLAALLKHLAFVEDHWMQVHFLGRPLAGLTPWGEAPWEVDPDWELHSAERDDPDELRALYAAACERSRRVVAGADLDTLSLGTDRPVRHSLRWILVHLIEETARHNGHADLLREAVDGSVGV